MSKFLFFLIAISTVASPAALLRPGFALALLGTHRAPGSSARGAPEEGEALEIDFMKEASLQKAKQEQTDSTVLQQILHIGFVFVDFPFSAAEAAEVIISLRNPGLRERHWSGAKVPKGCSFGKVSKKHFWKISRDFQMLKTGKTWKLRELASGNFAEKTI